MARIYNVRVIDRCDTNSTNPSRLVHNRFPTVIYRKYGSKEDGWGEKLIDYNDTWRDLGIHNASLTSLFNLKRICVEAKSAVARYNNNSKEKYHLMISSFVAPASLKAAQKAGIITGTPASKEHINKRYVNMDDPNDIITIDRWERKRATYYARPDVDYNAIIEELNKFISSTLEAFNG